ncbi:MAG: thiamine ABC transporter substrate-binding protein [Acidimicrobiia bacterium]
MIRWPALLFAAALALAVAACGDDSGSSGAEAVTLTLVTHDSFALSEDTLPAFTDETGIEVEVVPAGDAGAALNQAILTKDDPLGDVFFGVDNTFLSRALDEDLFNAYRSSELAKVPAEFQLDDEHRVTPIDYGDVCVDVDREFFAAGDVPRPRTLDDLTDDDYRGMLVVEDPATSSPGLAFLLATIAEYGADGWRGYWEQLRANDVSVTAGWEQAYNGEFSAGEGAGDRPLVVSYASSPPVAVYFSDPRPAASPVGVLLDTCFRQIEFAGILDGTGHEAEARQLVDFMLSRRYQEDLPLNQFVFPVREDAALPRVFTKFAEVAEDPLSIPAEEIGENRDRWIEEWRETVLR